MPPRDDNGATGLTCPRCGCGRFAVYYTRPKGGAIFRSRTCTGCGRRMLTHERPLAVEPAPVITERDARRYKAAELKARGACGM